MKRRDFRFSVLLGWLSNFCLGLGLPRVEFHLSSDFRSQIINIAPGSWRNRHPGLVFSGEKAKCNEEVSFFSFKLFLGISQPKYSSGLTSVK